MADLGGTQIGRFTIVRSLGMGGSGAVFLVDDPQTARQVALKVLFRSQQDDKTKARLMREVELRTRVHHPAFPRLLEADFSGDAMLVATEYIAGESLRAALDRHTPTPKTSLRILREIAAGVVYLHAHGIVHRDISANNILLGSDGQSRIMDLGLATTLSQSFESGEMAGTLPYMAPEMFHDAPPSPAVDVWAIGVIGYELATGQLPFEGDNLSSFAYRIATEDLDLALLTGPLREAVRACLIKDPRHRATAAQVLSLLTEQGEKGTEEAQMPWMEGLAIISAAMEAIQTYIAVQDRKHAAEVFDATLERARDSVAIRDAGQHLARLVPVEVLDTLEARVRKCWTGFQQVLVSDESFLPDEVDRAQLALKRCICRELSRIHDLNGFMPEGELQRWWSYYCQRP